MGRLEDGRAVFVPRTAPGDLVELTAIEGRARFARARVAQVVEPGSGRVSPRCVHYERELCGGCQLQHLDPPTQLEAKRQIVADALVRIGRLEVSVPPLVPADAAWEYRSRITLALAPGRRHAGYHPLDRPDRVFPLERCHLARPELMVLWDAVRGALPLLPADSQQLVLRVDRAGGLHVVVKATGGQAWTAGPRLRERLAARGVAATIWWQPDQGALRVMAGDRSALPATVFEQVHPGLADRIRAEAVAALGALGGVHAWDLYAGIGETTEALLAGRAQVSSVELDRQAVEYATARGPVGSNVSRHQGRVEAVVGTLPTPGVVITNPPRAGMAPEALAAIRAAHPGRVVYISCDPATLARDLAVLCATTEDAPGFRLRSVQAYDLFPQTAHVETVAVLEG
ncbi:MAG: class I SAM-dependent RNA methyltransferase [Gemmatimonadales bacterium]|nr:class I SAM-dependent RNA methyltransferase [Gemmatimonadales bacterium]